MNTHDTSSNKHITSDALRDLAVGIIDEMKGEEIRVIDLRGKTSIADYMLIASGSSGRQVVAIAEHLMMALKKQGIAARDEGMAQGDWVLLDGGDIIVHLFKPEVRAFYNIEKLWGAEPPAYSGPEHIQTT